MAPTHSGAALNNAHEDDQTPRMATTELRIGLAIPNYLRTTSNWLLSTVHQRLCAQPCMPGARS